MYVIPLTTDPNQTFQCTIPIDGENRRLIFGLSYNSAAEYWTMSITDPEERKMLVDSLPVQVGEFPAANLLGQYVHLKIGSATIVRAGPASEHLNPSDKSLGADYFLVWGDTIA